MTINVFTLLFSKPSCVLEWAQPKIIGSGTKCSKWQNFAIHAQYCQHATARRKYL